MKNKWFSVCVVDTTRTDRFVLVFFNFVRSIVFGVEISWRGLRPPPDRGVHPSQVIIGQRGLFHARRIETVTRIAEC